MHPDPTTRQQLVSLRQAELRAHAARLRLARPPGDRPAPSRRMRRRLSALRQLLPALRGGRPVRGRTA